VGPIGCGYRNTSDRMVILRCLGSQEFYLERVVFPFELLSFSCPAGSEVEIWTHGLGGPELLETIRCEELMIEPLSGIEAQAAVASLDDVAAENPWLQAG
jgi:hypothetical protein